MRKKILDYVWPVIGLLAVVGSIYMLYNEFRGQSVADEVWAGLRAIPSRRYLAAALSTLLAYAALAWYDRIALLYLGVKHISWLFISVCSFTTYALSHNIGVSVFSGAMVRYRAYSSKGLSAGQVATLVVFCSYTFALGTVFLAGILLTFRPDLLQRLHGMLPDALTRPETALAFGLACLGGVALYVLGSLMHFRPIEFGKLHILYPRPGIMGRQMFAAPMELIGAAGIIYLALPETSNPGYLVILGTFLLSFSAGIVSNAPGGLGVFELVFIKAMPDTPQTTVLSALLVFRLFYLVIPMLIGLVVVLVFERGRLAQRQRGKEAVAAPQEKEPAR